MLLEINKLKTILMEMQEKQSEQSKKINLKLEEIHSEMKNIKEELEEEKRQRKDFAKLIIERIEKLEKCFKASKEAQISCFKELIRIMTGLDL